MFDQKMSLFVLARSRNDVDPEELVAFDPAEIVAVELAGPKRYGDVFVYLRSGACFRVQLHQSLTREPLMTWIFGPEFVDQARRDGLITTPALSPEEPPG